MSSALAPQQRRSRETQARLLQATIEMLEKHGLDGATIPRIAAAAGIAPATVYRRFRDRDALFRAAFMDVLEKSAAANQALRIESFKNATFEGVAFELVGALIKQYRTYPGLLRAFMRFTENDSDEAFRAKAIAIVSANFKRIGDLLYTFRAEIAHRNPKRAILFGLLSVGTNIEVKALEELSMWNFMFPISDSELQKESTRSLLAYLRSPNLR
ncbi:MAG: TetR/AcrR family transcriptional regulator [Candidatus Baltobacteraceae bacterium]